MLHIVILAGGSGTRLWPLSREKYPKQLLSLITDKSLIQETALRVKDYPIYVVTNQETDFIIAHQLGQVLPDFKKEKHILVEPCGRNTAPAIAYACNFFQEKDVLAILPADHTIKKTKEFQSLLKEAVFLAEQGYIVTFGIVPTRAETGYGYIKTQEKKVGHGFLVDSFKEKPDKATAEQYLRSGGYYWNSGMFVFSVQTMRQELAKYAPKILETALQIGNKKSVSVSEYEQFPSISIDYAVMEKTKQLVLLPADIDWSDIGGFESLWENLPKDSHNNAWKGENILAKNINSMDNLFFSTCDKKIFAVLGIKDLVVVDTVDALLIADKKESQNIKKIVEQLKQENQEEAILHKIVFRPWGYYKSLAMTPYYQVKEITVYPLQKLSLQSHRFRSESWTVVLGEALVEKGKDPKNLESYSLKPQDMIFIPQETVHRLSNPSSTKELKIIEVQMGSYLGEDDITRYEDIYGRGGK